MVTKEERSKQIWVFRFWAILSVCCAHLPMSSQHRTIDYLVHLELWVLEVFLSVQVIIFQLIRHVALHIGKKDFSN